MLFLIVIAKSKNNNNASLLSGTVYNYLAPIKEALNLGVTNLK